MPSRVHTIHQRPLGFLKKQAAGIRHTSFPLLLIPCLFFLLSSCQPQPRIDDELFRQVDYATEDLEELVDTSRVLEEVMALPRPARQGNKAVGTFKDLL